MKRLFVTLAALSVLAPAIPAFADETAPAGGSPAPSAETSGGAAPAKSGGKKHRGLRRHKKAAKKAAQ